MVIDIKMCRFENVTWGFRLVGGADFEYPLTVVKVTEGSIAEGAGLLAGDVIVRINDTPASPLTHEESNKIITSCGNVFFLGVQRENEEEYLTPKCFPTTNNTVTSTPKTFLDVTALPPPIVIEQPVEYRAASEANESIGTNEEPMMPVDEPNVQYLPDLEERPCSVLSEETERKLVEEEIAAVLSGESEVLKEHNTIGIFPKPGVCMSSDVLRTLNDEATKTKLEKEKENRRWTTFLQKPDRPIPKSKAQLEAERRAANAYKVKIVMSAPRSSRSVSPTPLPAPEPVKEPTPPPAEPEPEPEPEPEAPTPVDTEVPNLEETGAQDDNQSEEISSEQLEIEKSDKEKESTPESKETEDEDKPIETSENVDETPEQEVNAEPMVEKTEEELALERQLADVQKQLAALSNLPTTIQSTLDSVSRQLADLLPAIKLQQEKQKSPEAREISLEQVDEHPTPSEPGDEENCHESVEKNANANAVSQQREQDNKANEQIANDTNEARDTIDKNPIKQQEATTTSSSCSMRTAASETQQMEDEQKLKKQKNEQKYDVIEELEEHLERKSNPKRSKRAFGPLTPASDRPLVLPGGRRWYRPKDAYNDEFIAETLSAQAELITGSTLGVNFMKYQKPEKKIDLDRSEVYKVIHHLDRQPMRGIEVRPPVVPSEADVRKAAQS